MSRKLSKLALASAVLGAMAMGSAYATPELTITSGADSVTVIGVGGNVSFSSADFDGWDITVLAGSSFAPGLHPWGLDLTNLSVTCAGGPCSADNLTVALSDNGFTQAVGVNGLHQSLTGAITGSVTQNAYFDVSNALFGKGGSIGGPLTCSADCALGEVGGGPAGPGAYSLTIEDVLSAGVVGYSLDSQIKAPEPGTIALFGAALLGCALFLGRRRLPNL